MKIIAQLFPNREFRISVSPEKLPEKETFSGDCCENDSHSQNRIASIKTEPENEPPCPPLDIGSDFQESQKSGWGKLGRKTKFGLTGKRTLQRIGGVFDRLFKPAECLFLTGTLPGGTDAAFRAIAEWSSWLVSRLKSWLKYYADGLYDFYVWELQERGALHLHYCLAVPDPSKRAYLLEAFKPYWVGLLQELSKVSGVDVFERAEGGSWASQVEVVQAYAQEVRKSVAAYLSKYCGKDKGQDRGHYYPVRWWGASRRSTSALKEMTREVVVTDASDRSSRVLLEEIQSVGTKLFSVLHSYTDRSGWSRVLVGYEYHEHPQSDTWQEILIQFGGIFKTMASKGRNLTKLESGLLNLFSTPKVFSLVKGASSQPLNEILEQIKSDIHKAESLSLTDSRELLSVICDIRVRPEYVKLIHDTKALMMYRVRTMQSVAMVDSMVPACKKDVKHD